MIPLYSLEYTNASQRNPLHGTVVLEEVNAFNIHFKLSLHFPPRQDACPHPAFFCHISVAIYSHEGNKISQLAEI
jgi:hypothetical protein